ncbi:hypothetical protein B0T11DRAFT_274952 [Plectosphaerella cucumerina]|uniref:Uncharacterized protein n=1 Tax=Plectosphaerella cucumerina TaxID=40658 RepID=A0A8K0TIY4_9PEZI|nr:hypothetical protein B0T11DRAFT_274952 [Plectosphaerella cucumerina]
MWYAASREDSIPGTRLYYTRILCGLEEEEQVQSNKSRAPRKSGGNMSATRA